MRENVRSRIAHAYLRQWRCRAGPASDVVRLAAAAGRHADLAELTGDQSLEVKLFTGPGHARLPAVRDAMNAFPFVADREPPSLAHMQARLAQAWAARHGAPNHREVLGALLPGLIEGAQLAVRHAELRLRTGVQRRRC